MAKNLTPAHLRCPYADCPSVHELEDGRLLIVGTGAFYEAKDRGIPVDQLREEAIIIDRELLSGLLTQAYEAGEKAQQERDAELEFARRDW